VELKEKMVKLSILCVQIIKIRLVKTKQGVLKIVLIFVSMIINSCLHVTMTPTIVSITVRV